MFITEKQRKNILEIGYPKIGNKYQKGYKCNHFIQDIYIQVGVEMNLKNHPNINSMQISEKEFIGYIFFLRRKECKLDRRITHMGIIFPDSKLLHYSRWMGEFRIYEVCLSSFSDIFEIYDFVSPNF